MTDANLHAMLEVRFSLNPVPNYPRLHNEVLGLSRGVYTGAYQSLIES
jgi:hypothetical protein